MAKSDDSGTVRIQPTVQQRRVIAEAAKLRQVSVSRFVLQSALEDAQAVLADQLRFKLTAEQWRNFVAALDAPPKSIPALRQLLSEPGVLDAR